MFYLVVEMFVTAIKLFITFAENTYLALLNRVYPIRSRSIILGNNYTYIESIST